MRGNGVGDGGEALARSADAGAGIEAMTQNTAAQSGDGANWPEFGPKAGFRDSRAIGKARFLDFGTISNKDGIANY